MAGGILAVEPLNTVDDPSIYLRPSYEGYGGSEYKPLCPPNTVIRHVKSRL